MRLDQIAVEFGDLADGNVKGCDLLRVGLARALKRFCKDGLREFEFFLMIQKINPLVHVLNHGVTETLREKTGLP